MTSVATKVLPGSSLLVSPNPVREEMRVQFTLSRAERVKLSVYNLLGQEVAQMLDADLNAGEHVLPLSIQHSPFNTLFVRLQTPTFTHVQTVQVMP
jgi:hypothetical protein